METTGLKFRKTSLLNYTAISKPGKYRVKATSNVSENNLFTDENGQSRYIVSLAAIESGKLPALVELFKDAEEVDIEQTNGLFLTASIWKRENQVQSLPMKNEEVEVIVGYVPNREGEEVLRVTNISVMSGSKGDKIDFDSIAKKAAVKAEGTLEHA